MKKTLISIALLLTGLSLTSCRNEANNYSGIWQSTSESNLSIRISFDTNPYAFAALILVESPDAKSAEYIVDAKSIKNEQGILSFYAKRVDESDNEVNHLVTLRKTSNENHNSNINITLGGIGSESIDLGEFRFIRSHKRLIPSISKVAAGYESLFNDKNFLEIFLKNFASYGDRLQNNLAVSSGLNLLPDGTYLITGIAPHSGGSEEGVVTISDVDVEGAVLTEENIYRTKNNNKIIDHWINDQTHNKVYIIGEKIHEPRFGKVGIEEMDKNSIYSNVIIKLNGKVIYDYEKKNDADVVGVTIEAMYNLKDEDVYVIGNSSGGTACPGLYKIISVKPDLSYYVSSSFGTCSDLFKSFVKNLTNDSIEITMPNNDGKNIKFLYKDRNVHESKAL